MEKSSRFYIIFLLLLSALLAFAPLAYAQHGPQSDNEVVDKPSIKWVSMDDAVSVAKTNKKPLLLFFKAKWCKYCQKMRLTTLTDASVIKVLSNDFNSVLVDVDDHRKIAEQFHVRILPSVLILDDKGEELVLIRGYKSPTNLLRHLNQYTDKKIPDKQYAIVTKSQNNPVTIQVTGGQNEEQTKKLEKQAKKISQQEEAVTHLPIFTTPPEQAVEKAAVVVCTTNVCSIPITDAREIESVVTTMKQGELKVPKAEMSEIKYLNQTLPDMMLNPEANMLSMVSAFWMIGLLLALTPCIFPLLILIASLLGASAGNMSQVRAIILTCVYILSLSLTYAFLGLMSSYFGVYLSSYFNQPWVLITFSLLITMLGLSYLGFYLIKLPWFLRHYAAQQNRLQSHYDYSQAFFMGMAATVIAAPCASAPLIAILGYVTALENATLGFFALFIMGIGMGSPLLLAVIVGKRYLPSAGKWQEFIRIIFGFILIGVGIWIVSTLLPPTWNMIIWAVLFLYFGNFLLSYSGYLSSLNSYVVAFKTLGIIALIYGGAIFVGMLLGNVNPVNPLGMRFDIESKKVRFVTVDTPKLLKEKIEHAKQFNKPTLVLFSADWCQSCHALKESVLENAHIKSEMKAFNLIKVDLTQPGSPGYDLAKKYHIVGPPEIIFFYSNGKLSDYRLGGLVSAATFDSALEAIKAKDAELDETDAQPE